MLWFLGKAPVYMRLGVDSEFWWKHVPNDPKKRLKPDFRVLISYFPSKIRIFGFLCLVLLRKPGFVRFFGFIENKGSHPYLCGHRPGAGVGGHALAAVAARQRRALGHCAIRLEQTENKARIITPYVLFFGMCISSEVTVDENVETRRTDKCVCTLWGVH